MLTLFFFKNIFMAPQILICCTKNKSLEYVYDHAFNIPMLVLNSRQLSNPFFFSFPTFVFLFFFGLNDSTLFKCSNISYKFWNILTKFFHKIEHLLTHGSQLNSYERPIWNWINAQFVLFFRYFLWELENILRYNLTSTISWQHSWNGNTSNSEWCWGDKNKINQMLGKIQIRYK